VTDNGTPPLGDFEAITITVTGETAPSSLTISDVNVIEMNEGMVEARFKVTLSPASGLPVTVDFTTADGTATAPSDYVPTKETLTFSPGRTIQFITVKVMGDRRVEQEETFLVKLNNAINASIADGEGVGTIHDDDVGVVVRPRSASYWRHHPIEIGMYLPQTLGGLSVTTVDQAQTILKRRHHTRDANNKLRA